jgi:hypothetical protein
MCRIVWCTTGPGNQADTVFAPIRRVAGGPTLDLVGPLRYPAPQGMFDPACACSIHTQRAGAYVNVMMDEGTDRIRAAFRDRQGLHLALLTDLATARGQPIARRRPGTGSRRPRTASSTPAASLPGPCRRLPTVRSCAGGRPLPWQRPAAIAAARSPSGSPHSGWRWPTAIPPAGHS